MARSSRGLAEKRSRGKGTFTSTGRTLGDKQEKMMKSEIFRFSKDLDEIGDFEYSIGTVLVLVPGGTVGPYLTDSWYWYQ